ncbi:MAG: glycosyl hydrolase family 28-related protein [Paludibacter sp.]|nr:glycosyl hydrolase family 28-related protein [Paludibacter sp.]
MNFDYKGIFYFKKHLSVPPSGVRGLLLLAVFVVLIHPANAIDYNVKAFGAKGDGLTIDTKAIQSAIDSCTVTGGRVVFANGQFVTGTIYLKSNVTLFVDKGAGIIGSTNIADYPHNQLDFRFFGDTWVSQSLIFARNAVNIGIEGTGTIDGRGSSFKVKTKIKPDKYRNRPYLLWIAGCQKVRVTGIELRNSAMWMQSYIRCDDLRIEGINVFNHSNHNNDMMDIDGCRNVVINNIIGDTDDDGITFKSTCDRISENIVVSNCVLSSHCNALKFGTESTTGFRNVSISNCVIRPSEIKTNISGSPEGTAGLVLEIVDGGLMENINISSLVIDSPQVPIFVRLGNRARKHYAEAPQPGIGKMNGINISNVIARSSGKFSSSIMGVEGGNVENITLSDIHFIATGGGTAEDAAAKVEELPAEYPEATMFGYLPSSALYVRHVRGLKLTNITFDLKNSDARPLMVFDDVIRAKISDTFKTGIPAIDLLKQIHCTDIELK